MIRLHWVSSERDFMFLLRYILGSQNSGWQAVYDAPKQEMLPLQPSRSAFQLGREEGKGGSGLYKISCCEEGGRERPQRRL